MQRKSSVTAMMDTAKERASSSSVVLKSGLHGAQKMAQSGLKDASAFLSQFRRKSTASATEQKDERIRVQHSVGDRVVTLYGEVDSSGRLNGNMYFNSPDGNRYAHIYSYGTGTWSFYLITDKQTGGYSSDTRYELVVDVDQGDVVAKPVVAVASSTAKVSTQSREQSGDESDVDDGQRRPTPPPVPSEYDSDSEDDRELQPAPPVPYGYVLPNGQTKDLQYREENGAWVHTYRGVDYHIVGGTDESVYLTLVSEADKDNPTKFSFNNNGELIDQHGRPAVGKRPVLTKRAGT